MNCLVRFLSVSRSVIASHAGVLLLPFLLVAALPFRCLCEDGTVALDNVVADERGYTLAPGPAPQGVVLLRQEEWPPDVVQVFHDIPWLDAASIRLRWAALEPADQEFEWGPIDSLLTEVRSYNAAHPDANRTLHIRVMGGVHSPEWFSDKGVRFYDTTHSLGPDKGDAPLRVPMPYDNPEFLRQLREVYAAMRERYVNEPLVSVYHGTWSAGPWDEIFHPQNDAPLPPDYTPEKFIQGMVDQLDILIEEFCLHGKVAELPYSGKYPQKFEIDITGALNARIVERLGRRSPYLYIQTNGWGQTNLGAQTVSWGHELDVQFAYGDVNLALQALGTNTPPWMPQGDWLQLVDLARLYDAAYLELYPPDFMPVDDEHNLTLAMTGTGDDGEFLGYRPWLKQRDRNLYVREGTLRLTFECGAEPHPIDRLTIADAAPAGTSVTYRTRTRLADGEWSQWAAPDDVESLPPGHLAQIEARLHTDDGFCAPRVAILAPDVGPTWDLPVWTLAE